jgi:hypothetical protein
LSNYPERLFGSIAETYVVESNLDVSIFVHELDAAIQTLKVAPNDASNYLEHNVILQLGFLILVYKVFKNYSDCSHNSN